MKFKVIGFGLDMPKSFENFSEMNDFLKGLYDPYGESKRGKIIIVNITTKQIFRGVMNDRNNERTALKDLIETTRRDMEKGRGDISGVQEPRKIYIKKPDEPNGGIGI